MDLCGCKNVPLFEMAVLGFWNSSLPSISFYLMRSCLTDVFKSALKFGTFTAIMVTYIASALLHVSTKWESYISS